MKTSDELHIEFRSIISHMLLGYECDISGDDFDKLIDLVHKEAEQYAKEYHNNQIQGYFTGKIVCECGIDRPGDTEFFLCNHCRKPC